MSSRSTGDSGDLRGYQLSKLSSRIELVCIFHVQQDLWHIFEVLSLARRWNFHDRGIFSCRSVIFSQPSLSLEHPCAHRMAIGVFPRSLGRCSIPLVRVTFLRVCSRSRKFLREIVVLGRRDRPAAVAVGLHHNVLKGECFPRRYSGTLTI